jgi:shikimate dehydrogenase
MDRAVGAAMIRGTTRVAAVIGWPVEHSKSPLLINAAFAATSIDAVLIPIGVPPEGLAAVIAGLRAMRAFGASVTLPHKVAIAGLCDDLAPSAREIGAVNCIHVAGARVTGHNTDAGGFADALAESGFERHDKHVVLLGAGGAARAVSYGLAGAEIEVVARREVDWATVTPWNRRREALARADLVVDCTPTGLDASERIFVDSLPLDALPAHALVATLIYHRQTLLLERAAARGHRVLDGRNMLIYQGARAFTIWTGQQAPIAAMKSALG